MNKKSLKGLLYYDYRLTKKAVFSNLILDVVLIVIIGLVWLSIKYGNLKLAIDSFLPEDRAQIINALTMASKYIPVTFLCALGTVCADLCTKEVNPKWNRFRMTLPVTPGRYALGKYIYMLILNLSGGILSAIYMFVYSVIVVGEQNKRDYLNLLLFMCGMATFIILFMDLSLFARSMETAGIILCIILMGGCFLLSMASEEVNRVAQLRDGLTHFSAKYWWVLILYYVLIYVIGYGLTVLLYKRRDK